MYSILILIKIISDFKIQNILYLEKSEQYLTTNYSLNKKVYINLIILKLWH